MKSVDIINEMKELNKREDLYLIKSSRIDAEKRMIFYFFRYVDGLGRHYKTFVL